MLGFIKNCEELKSRMVIELFPGDFDNKYAIKWWNEGSQYCYVEVFEFFWHLIQKVEPKASDCDETRLRPVQCETLREILVRLKEEVAETSSYEQLESVLRVYNYITHSYAYEYTSRVAVSPLWSLRLRQRRHR